MDAVRECLVTQSVTSLCEFYCMPAAAALSRVRAGESEFALHTAHCTLHTQMRRRAFCQL